MNFCALFLSINRLSEVVAPLSLELAADAKAIALVPNDRLQRGVLVGVLGKAAISWLEKASFPTLDQLIKTNKLSDGAFFTHEGLFTGKRIINNATLFSEGKPLTSVPILQAKLKSIGPGAILKVQVHPRNYTGDSASVELSGNRRLFMIGRLTISTPPVLEAQAYAIGYLHEEPGCQDDSIQQKNRWIFEITFEQEADYHKFDYGCHDKVHIPGLLPKNKSNKISINGYEIKIGNTPFKLLLRLVVELKKNEGGWVATETLKEDDAIKDPQNYHVYNHLRTPLQGVLIDKNPELFIENDGSKHYRISTHPDFVTYDREKLLGYPDSQIRKLAADLP